MDLCTYINFRYWIHNPENSFRTLRNIDFDISTLACSEHFAECIGYIGDERYIFYAPISKDAIHYACRAEEAIGQTPIAEFKVLRDEAIHQNIFMSTCSIICERYPEGVALNEALYTHSSEHLTYGLKSLRRRLSQHNICHTNLTPENIIVGRDHEWYPIRWYYAVNGKRKDYSAFRNLAELIERCSLPKYDVSCNTLHSPLSSYSTHNLAQQERLSERRYRTTTSNGTGFLDQNRHCVVENIYLRATDFVEDRAIVTLPCGKTGVINRNGRYIIMPQYDDIEYDVTRGILKAHSGDSVTIFDYLGNEVEHP